nr:MAG TPA: ferredoxin I [Caudoviricetes sp.]
MSICIIYHSCIICHAWICHIQSPHLLSIKRIKKVDS